MRRRNYRHSRRAPGAAASLWLRADFAIYVVYDLGRLLHWNVGEGILSVLFLIASLSALYAVWGLYREKA